MIHFHQGKGMKSIDIQAILATTWLLVAIIVTSCLVHNLVDEDGFGCSFITYSAWWAAVRNIFAINDDKNDEILLDPNHRYPNQRESSFELVVYLKSYTNDSWRDHPLYVLVSESIAIVDTLQ